MGKPEGRMSGMRMSQSFRSLTFQRMTWRSLRPSTEKNDALEKTSSFISFEDRRTAQQTDSDIIGRKKSATKSPSRCSIRQDRQLIFQTTSVARLRSS